MYVVVDNSKRTLTMMVNIAGKWPQMVQSFAAFSVHRMLSVVVHQVTNLVILLSLSSFLSYLTFVDCLLFTTLKASGTMRSCWLAKQTYRRFVEVFLVHTSDDSKAICTSKTDLCFTNQNTNTEFWSKIKIQILSWIWNGLLNNEHIHFKWIMFWIGLGEIYGPFVVVIPKSMGSRPMVYAKM